MSFYDQLLLEFGGGIINPYSQDEPYHGDASVVIGIGGTGIAALKKLKQNVFQRLKPDNPGAPLPTYSHIKFIAIDSDVIDPGGGRGKLSEKELFSIVNPDLMQTLWTEAGRKTVRKDVSMSWMDIDNIPIIHGPFGTGAIRQVGRYFLISKADELKLTILRACVSAIQAAHANSVTVYIFAGLSGGTGSGCFIDTCYIVRQLMNENGWAESGKIIGLFFLPDVVNSKREVAAYQPVVKLNNSNGYAAMKELNYLMNLRQAEDRFYQNYGGFTINTQEAPVDVCHLISATMADGHVRPDGFDYCINVAADYVMSYLIDVEIDGPGATLRGHLANINLGTSVLPRIHGAPRIYHVVGASNAEVPMTQFSTYLAAGFMNRFSQMVGREKVKAELTHQKVIEWAGKLNLTPNGILARINHGTTSLKLPDVDKRVLKSLGQMPRGKVPESWVMPGIIFLDTSQGQRTENCNCMKQEISSYALTSLPAEQTASVISSIFKLLYTICTDPGYGPYYAAWLVHNDGYDLGAVVDGLIIAFEQLKSTQELILYGSGNGSIADEIVEVSADFSNAHFINERSRYNRYKQAVEDFFITTNRIKELKDAISVMKIVKIQLSRLYQSYIVPMIEMLDHVKQSFDENINFLRFSEAVHTNAYTWQILKLSDVKDSLDDAIKALSPKSLVTDFLDEVMRNYQEWINRDSDRIAAFICSFMKTTFDSQMNISLQAFLTSKFPMAAPPVLINIIENKIICRAYTEAAPLFWCDLNFNMETDTFQTSSLSVPVSDPFICSAAVGFGNRNTLPCTIRMTHIKDRIIAIRQFSSVPFYAYGGVGFLKDAYESVRAGKGAGLHLYAKTGRGSDGTGDRDWAVFLPEPVPYSVDNHMTKNPDEKINLYKKAFGLGIIGPELDNNEQWLLRVSKPIDEREYTIDDFMTIDPQERSVLNTLAIKSVRSKIKDRIEHGWDEVNLERKIIMANDGARMYGEEVVSAVRLDYFLAFPVQQELVIEEIRKHDILEDQLRQLKAIEEQYIRQCMTE